MGVHSRAAQHLQEKWRTLEVEMPIKKLLVIPFHGPVVAMATCTQQLLGLTIAASLLQSLRLEFGTARISRQKQPSVQKQKLWFSRTICIIS